MPHEPQLEPSAIVLTHDAPAQLVKPDPHATVQAPFEHAASALVPAGHAWPHAAQFAASLIKLLSHPLVGSLSQSANPGTH